MISPPYRRLLTLAGFLVTAVLVLSYSRHGRQSDVPPGLASLTSSDLSERVRTTDDGAVVPVYLALHRSGALRARAETLWNMMHSCTLCPRRCGARRLVGAAGFCRAAGTRLIVASHHSHFGEERPLVGTGGSGTIFFSHCSLRCVFCQNWDISQRGRGREVRIEDLAAMMLDLQNRGSHNINLVTPTHYVAHILKAIDIAAGNGLRLPIVYNTAGWERLEVLQLLDGVVDIYLPDIKYGDPRMAAMYSEGADRYVDKTKQAILEMHRQVGVAQVADDGLVHRGLMIRHLVMPSDVSGSTAVLEWIARELPHDTYINIMSQYRPAYRAYQFPKISRPVTAEEYRVVIDKAKELGLTQLDYRGFQWLR